MTRSLLVGLGNPGRKYEGTRHNIGFMALERLARRHGLSLSQTKFQGWYATGRIGSADVVLLAPQTYMNLSGRSVAPAAKFYNVPPEQIIVAHDEIDLAPGRLQVKIGGGHGGHNGLRDIIAQLGSRDFVRLRLGVGRPEQGDVAQYVLSRFYAHEEPAISELIETACDAWETILEQGPQAAQNRFN